MLVFGFCRFRMLEFRGFEGRLVWLGVVGEGELLRRRLERRVGFRRFWEELAFYFKCRGKLLRRFLVGVWFDFDLCF